MERPQAADPYVLVNSFSDLSPQQKENFLENSVKPVLDAIKEGNTHTAHVQIKRFLNESLKALSDNQHQIEGGALLKLLYEGAVEHHPFDEKVGMSKEKGFKRLSLLLKRNFDFDPEPRPSVGPTPDELDCSL